MNVDFTFWLGIEQVQPTTGGQDTKWIEVA